MSVRSFHSVFMATAVAGAALGCYLVSLRVASERAALEAVEAQIVRTQVDIRLLQTEVGTRSRLAQLERWNVRALALSAPSASPILGDKFQLARLVRPEPKLDVESPVVLASAPAPEPVQPLAQESESNVAPAQQLLHEASYKAPQKLVVEAKPQPVPAKPVETRKVAEKSSKSSQPAPDKKAGDKSANVASASVTRPLRIAKVDPLAPLPAGHSAVKGSRTDR
jgi:hypothetical protein